MTTTTFDPETLGDYTYPDTGHTVTSASVRRALDVLNRRASRGVTSRELALLEMPGDVSGVSSACSPLSTLHRHGAVALLKEKRAGYKVYVLPEYVRGRAVKARGTHHCKTCTCEDR